MVVIAMAAGTLPLLGSPAHAAAGDVVVSSTEPVYLVDDGLVSTLAVRLTVEGGGKLAEEVTVGWSTGTGSATAGKDYLPARGSVFFAAGTPSGATRSFSVQTRQTRGQETAETIPVELSTTSGRATVAAERPTLVINAHGLPYLDKRLPVKRRVADLLSRMTLAEKVGQMTQAERAAVDGNRDAIATYRLGSLLSGGGSTPPENTPQAWADMIDAYQLRTQQTRLQIPLIYGVDSVHGHGNLYGATLFPHNIGLGATRDPALVKAAEHVTATETRATGIPWVFAPCICVARDTRWGRTYESFGEDPSLVTAMETSIDGLQGTKASDLRRADHVLATAKHFAGDGDTDYGTGDDPKAYGSNYPIDQGIAVTNRKDFKRLALQPYVPAVRKHHVGSVMPSYSSVDWTGDGVGNPIKMHADRELIQGWLKNKVGFDGFVISDYHGIDQIPGDRASDVRTWVNAGGDMAMEPDDYQQFESALIDEVDAGRVSKARVNDAVRRILTKKFELGLFEQPYADRSNIDSIGSSAHRAVARRAAAESQVLLKNAGGALPVRSDAKVYVAGRNADNLGNQAGGWTITWQGQSGRWTKGTTILQGMRQVAPRARITYSEDASASMASSDVGVVVVGETPYSEGFGDVGGPQWAYDPADRGVPREPKTLTLKASDKAVVHKVCSALPKCVVLVVSGRPQVLSDQLGEIDALVASWLPGTEGEGVADVIFGRRPFTGQLSQTWPRSADQEPINVGDKSYSPLYPFGWGISTNVPWAGHGAKATKGSQSLRSADTAGEVLKALKSSPALRSRQGSNRQRELVSLLRQLVQEKVADPQTGVPARPADLIARSDVALLKGQVGQAVALLLRAGGWLPSAR